MQLNGVIRSDREMADGRTIRYYDSKPTTRDSVDRREKEEQPGFGELRFDPLVNEWIAISSHRQHRIFLPPKELCPLCPTKGELLTEIPDSDYEVVVFDNRSPSFRPLDPSENDFSLPDYAGPETDSSKAIGKCEVICFTSAHGQSFKELTPQRVHTLLEAWRDRTHELSKEPFIRHIAPFENRGEEVGVTLHHPHGQIYAYSYLPPRVEKMLAIAKKYKDEFGRVLFDDILKRELADKTRIVAQNRDWVAFVPFAARYPFEIHVAPRRSVSDFVALDESASEAFAPIAKEVLQRLDGVFGVTMPYIASWHQAPVHEGRDVMRLHWQIQSVRRAPGKLKYLAGSESAFGAFMMDLKPEQSAQQLRDVKL